MKDGYYILLGDQIKKGPFKLAQIQAMWKDGHINGATKYWQEGLPDWTPCQSIAHILGSTQTEESSQSLPPLNLKPVAALAFKVIIVILVFRAFNGLFSSSRDTRSDTSSSRTPVHVVENSSWDGSVHQVKDWIKANTHDPSSVEYVSWSPVRPTNGGYTVSCTFRAKNAFGGKVTHRMVFILDMTGSVTQVFR